MVDNIGKTVKKTRELVEQYELLNENDVRGKVAKVQEMANDYGLKVDESNYEDILKLITELD
jgi:hypothetical protein